MSHPDHGPSPRAQGETSRPVSRLPEAGTASSALAIVGALAILGAQVILGVPAVAASASPQAGCEPIELSKAPSWTTSGAWSPDGESLLLVDTLYSQILRYDRRGVLEGPIPAQGQRDESLFHPMGVRVADDGRLAVSLTQGRMVYLGRGLRPEASKLLKGSTGRGAPGEGFAVESMVMWDAAPGALAFFGDLSDGDRWISGFLRAPLDEPSRWTLLQEVALDDPARNFYKLGYDTVAVLGDDVYVLPLSEPFRILRFGPDGERETLTAFPEALGLSIPQVPYFSSPRDLPEVMGAIERTTMPVALYGWEGRLYLLSRAPQEQGEGTRWSLTAIDPEGDRVVGTAYLPLSSPHLTVAVGPERWAFVRKGPVEALGRQDIRGALVVEAGQLRSLSSGNLCEPVTEVGLRAP